MKAQNLIFVVYDGVENSVFEGQVVQPLLKKLHDNKQLKITIVSFERFKPLLAKINTVNELHPNLKLHILHKIPFIGNVSLWYAARQLKKFLAQFYDYELIARGPKAGIIGKKVLNNNCTQLTIQARGLLAEEYLFSSHAQSWIQKIAQKMRYKQFNTIESKAYTLNDSTIIIEAVSPALREYIFNMYNTPLESIKVACDDIPQSLSEQERATLKSTMRTACKIPQDALVYCYNGSIKPWQCPGKVVHYFKEKLAQNPSSFLLVLTQDISGFKKLLQDHEIPSSSFEVTHVPHAEIYRYLAACDIGLLFRDLHIINWVSRPTKALEYEAAGLKIEHNNTIAWLNNSLKASFNKSIE